TGRQQDENMREVVAEYVGDRVDRADPDSGREVLAFADPYTNHNGGMMQFGSDGLLYIGTGDGGDGGDTDRLAQNVNSLHGKMLRIDVDGNDGDLGYGIPLENPFASGGGRGEIFMIGLRNPWRWSFDTNGDIYIGDVGQGSIEEINVIGASD